MPKRRTRGDGGLYQRHDHPSCPALVEVDTPDGPKKERPKHACRGRWVGNVEINEGGKKVRKSVYGRTKEEARKRLVRAVRAKEDGTLVVSSITVETWLDEWLEKIAARTLRPQTIKGYRSKIERDIKPAIGKVRLVDLRPTHIRHLHDTMRDRGLAEASVRQAHAIIKRALKVAVMEGNLVTSPADRADSPGTHTAKPQQLSVAEAKRVLDVAGDDVRWWLALFVGLRQGEALGLDWQDVDFSTGLVVIRQTLQTGSDGKLTFGPPKSKSSQRTFPAPLPVLLRLRALWESEGMPATGLVIHVDGKPRQPKRDWLEWKALLKRAAAPEVTLHSARGTAASILEDAKVPDRLVAQILGHSNVKMTHRYQNADIDRMREAFAAAERVIASPPTALPAAHP